MTNLGLATTTILGGSGSMTSSYTIPIGARVYVLPSTRADGFFIGPHVEFGTSNFENKRSRGVRAFGADLGYKWVFESGFSLELCDGIGLIQTKELAYSESFFAGPFGTVTNSYPEGEWENLAFVAYMLSVKCGIVF
jgi:hypothetical protein